MHTKYQAELYAMEEFENVKFNDWVTEEELVYWLVDMGIWNKQKEDMLKLLETQIDDYKLELFNSLLLPNNIKSIRKKLEAAKKNHSKLYNARHSLDYVTLDGYISSVKNQYILVSSLYDDNGRVFKDMGDVDINLLNNLSNQINDDMLSVSMFRKIARSDLWRNYWNANKNNIFSKPVIDWTDEQKTLVVISKMYDSAYEHPECPPDNVIEDDDMFDGWMIKQKRDNDKQKEEAKSKQVLEGKKLNNARELFVKARSQEEANAIYKLNSPQSKDIIRQRNHLVTSNGGKEISEQNLPDVKQDLIMRGNQQFLQQVRK